MGTEMNRDDIIKAATEMANEVGLINMTRKALCERVGLKDGSFYSVAGCSFADLLDEIKPRVLPVALGSLKVSRCRVSPELRREHILASAVEHAKLVGYPNISRKGIAEQAGISPTFVNSLLGTLPKVRRALMREAIRQGELKIIAEGLAVGDVHARKAPPELKEQAIDYLANA